MASDGQLIASTSAVVLLFVVMSLLLVGAAVREVVYWRKPILQLRALLKELSDGTAPLDELKKLPPATQSLAEPLTGILHQLRMSKSELARLEMEVKHRVASRTEALERKLGSLAAQASRDVLTGLLSRRSMETELPAVVRSCRQKASDLQLMMIDVDHFKTLNDTLGHAAGDELLRQIGQVMRSSLRDGDSAFRYGGDEFVILLPGADATAARALADRLKTLVDGLSKHHRNLPRRPQLSVGHAALTDLPLGAPPEQLLSLADQRLYAIKHARPKGQQRVA